MVVTVSTPISNTKEEVLKDSLLNYTEKCITNYGSYVIQHRAIPDYRDGLKPVQRRILWSMYRLGLHSNKGHKKAARVVGDTMGKYHPHGDSAIYGSLVNMVNSSEPLVDGHGEYGWYNDGAAASRYTECRLSQYSDLFLLDKEYLEVIPKVPNFDSSDMEPLYLPSLVPNLFINGASGIAIGATTLIPAFELKGILTVTSRLLKGKSITPGICCKYLKFKYPYGGQCVSTPDELMELFEKGVGKVKFNCDYVEDIAKRTLFIVGLTPRFDADKVLRNMSELDYVQSVNDISSGTQIKISITLRKSIRKDSVTTYFNKIKSSLQLSLSYKLNITVRREAQVEDSLEAQADFKETTLPAILNDWVNWRIELEQKYLKHKIGLYQGELDRYRLLELAIDKLSVIFRILESKSDNLDERLAKELDIKTDDAHYILSQQARRLSRLNHIDIKVKIHNLLDLIKEAESHLKEPETLILTKLKERFKEL